MAAVSDGSLRVGPLMALPQLLRELGQDPAAIFAEAGVEPRLVEDPENTIGFTPLGRLLGLCVARTGCPHLGLLIGQSSGPECLGVVGMLMQHSPTLGAALRNVVLHLHLHDRGAIPSLTVAEGRAQLAYTIYQPGVQATAQIYDGALAIMANLLRALCGPGSQVLEVQISRARPADIEPYRRCFRAPLRFDSEHCALVFPASCLNLPIPGHDPALLRALEQRIASLTPPGDDDLRVQVQRVACNLLMCGRGSLHEVAEVFALHPRTLNRRLRARGTSFRELLDVVRQGLAYPLVRDTDLPLLTIAQAIGYGDASAFNHAFRRWTGDTPTAWRAGRGS
jgi:AraC-like DNA-binding protein